jgi:hypothetical protein
MFWRNNVLKLASLAQENGFRPTFLLKMLCMAKATAII